MSLNQMRKMKQDKGFTLIELLLVIIVLGILAAVVVFSVSGITDRGSTSACKASKSALNTAGEAYYAKKGAYPAATGNMTAAPDKFLGDLGGTLVVGTPAAGHETDTITSTSGNWVLSINYDTTGVTAPVITPSGTGSTGC